MGILNVTPDSFSDGGMFVDRERALDHARRMAADGADIIDIGGESTRPGAAPVPVDVELERVVPLVEALAKEGLRVSVDTQKPDVMRAALAAGAVMVNDVRALQAPGAMAALAASDAAVCLMHMQGEPADDAGRTALRRRGRRGPRLPGRPRAPVRGGGHRARPHRHRPGVRLRQDAGA